ncbi:hypothetical protein L249_0508, partial [Ophiocordyceps polyrhachis-furcata BCC 54312]
QWENLPADLIETKLMLERKKSFHSFDIEVRTLKLTLHEIIIRTSYDQSQCRFLRSHVTVPRISISHCHLSPHNGASLSIWPVYLRPQTTAGWRQQYRTLLQLRSSQSLNSVSNLTLYDIKAGFRKAQNAVMNYTDMEAKVREATNNEPWGASSTQLQEIANGTFNYSTLNEIMPMIYRRFTEKSAEEWRQIYKALQLLEFLIKHGSERVIDDARGHITLLKMLRQFHFIDQNGKDQGVNVRNRAKELAELLGDVERIRSERKKARATKNKYTGVEGGMSHGGGFSSSSSRYGGFGSESAGYGGGGGGGGANASYGGYSGGVYGDGGGFGGQASDFRDSAGRSDRFEEYDEFDEEDRPPKPSKRTGVKKTTSETAKKKEPEVDLFSFDEPEKGAAAPSNGLAAPAAANDDDEFDDFQSAAPSSSALGQPTATPLTSTASSTAHFAAPQPLSAPQKAELGQMVSTSSISPAPSGGAANYSSFASPPLQAQPPTAFQPTGPNYYGSVSSQPTAMSSLSSPVATTKPAIGSGSSQPASGGGGDAFGALWGKASAGIKKTSTPTAGPTMGQLAKEKSSAGIWGPPAATTSTTAQPTTGGGSASGDLLGTICRPRESDEWLEQGRGSFLYYRPSSYSANQARADASLTDSKRPPFSSYGRGAAYWLVQRLSVGHPFDTITTSSLGPALLPLHCKRLPLRTAGSTKRPRLSLVTPAAAAMAPPSLGALGLTFTAMRAMQAAALVAIIGLTSNFIAEMVTAGYVAPSPLVGTLVVACFAAVYTIITYILYWDSLLPLLISTAADGLCLIGVIAVACVVGKPVSYLSCPTLSDSGNMATFIDSLYRNLSREHMYEWVNPDKTTCYEIKAVWGLSICLCILYFMSAVASICLWKRIKGGPRPAVKDIE